MNLGRNSTHHLFKGYHQLIICVNLHLNANLKVNRVAGVLVYSGSHRGWF